MLLVFLFWLLLPELLLLLSSLEVLMSLLMLLYVPANPGNPVVACVLVNDDDELASAGVLCAKA